jgi:transposase-like protein
MDPPMVCCPHRACPARGQTGQGNIGIHARKDKRFLCTECRQTCSATTGTAVSRLRTAAETGTRVGTVLAHGCPPPALVAAFGFDERTVRRGLARGGGQGQAVQEHLVEPPRDLGQGQADDIRGKKQGGMVWLALAMLVRPRVGLAGAGREPRERTRRRRLSARGRACARQRPLRCGTAGLGSYSRAMRETCRDPVQAGALGRPRWRPWHHSGMAQVVKREAQRRGGDVERRLVDGPPARGETLRRRSQPVSSTPPPSNGSMPRSAGVSRR